MQCGVLEVSKSWEQLKIYKFLNHIGSNRKVHEWKPILGHVCATLIISPSVTQVVIGTRAYSQEDNIFLSSVNTAEIGTFFCF